MPASPSSALALFAALSAAPLAAQAEDLAAREAKLQQTGAQLLAGFAKGAESARLPSRAKAAWEFVLAHYDAEHKPAKAALAALAKAADAATPAQMRSTEGAWQIVRKKLGPLHRELGLAWLAANDLERGQRHLELAVHFDPEDAAAHQALGHEQFQGFYGSPEQIAFCKRLAAIEAKAKELAGTGYEPKTLGAEALPAELKNAGVPMSGAKSRRFVIWTPEATPEAAAAMTEWGERGAALLEFLLSGAPARVAQLGIGVRRNRWIAVLRTPEQWRTFFAKNPQLLAKLKVKEVPPQPNFAFESQSGPAELFLHAPELDADSTIAHVTMWGFASAGNEGLGQGLVHAMTGLLVGTTNTWFGAEPTTRAAGQKPLERDPKDWAARLREEIGRGQDWPLVQVPRERLTSFREAVRVKSWSFVLWLLARHPDRWTRVFAALESDKNPLPEAVDAAFLKELERSAADLEAEWRSWADGKSAIAKATGHSG